MAGGIEESRNETEEQARRRDLTPAAVAFSERSGGVSKALKKILLVEDNKGSAEVEQSERALRLARISTEADRVFGDPAKAAR